MTISDEERQLREAIAALQVDYARAAKPYIARLEELNNLHATPPVVTTKAISDPAISRLEFDMKEANALRPPTPVGWSDTDWIKHLEDREAHPLECMHINQGSMDALADAYEAEYNEWKATSV